MHCSGAIGAVPILLLTFVSVVRSAEILSYDFSSPSGSAVEIAYLKAEAAGLELGGGGYEFDGDYATKGLYYYTSGTYKNMAFFGTGGTMAQESAPVSPPKARISTSEASYNAALVSHMQDTYAATP